MADRYVRAGGGNWSVAGTWESTPGGGETVAKPTAADEVYLVAGSGQLTINETAYCRRFDCTGYANTTTHGAYSLNIGDATAPTGGVALLLAGTYTPNASSSIVFSSSGAGVHSINTGGKTIQTITFNNTGSYQFVTSTVTITGDIGIQRGTIDFNGITFSARSISSTGAYTRTITFGSSVITLTGTGPFNFTGSNFSVSLNTATVIISSASPQPAVSCIDGTDFNGLSIKFTNASGTATWTNSCTIKDLILYPSATAATLSITAGKTITLTGTLYCLPQVTTITFSGGIISKTSGIVNLYQVTSCTTTFSGGATFNLCNNCSVTPAQAATYGLTKVGGNHYIDYAVALTTDDTNIFTAYGFFKVAYTGATGTCPAIDEVCTKTETAKVSFIDPYEWSIGTGTIYFSCKTGVWTAGTVNCANGGTFDIAADTVNAAWKSFTLGALATRIAPGDIIKVAKSPAPTSIGNGTWTDQPATLPSTVTITNTRNDGTGLIKVYRVSHGFVTGDIVYIQDHTVNLVANGVWSITKVDNNYYTLDGSSHLADGATTGTATKCNRAVVKLATAQTQTIDQCDRLWTAAGSSTVTLDTSQYKEGDASCKVVKASPSNSTLYAYIATRTTLNLSGYQKISFWFRNQTVTLANQWKICLCSDNSGATPVDTFLITAIPTTGRFLPMTLTKVGGGNLGASIQSIALYSDTSAGTTTGIYLDNFIACTTNGLNLQSLISKNTLEQSTISATNYGNEAWYAIKNISEDGKIIFLDNETNSVANIGITLYGLGYANNSGGTSETVTTYIRETIKTEIVNSATVSVNSCLDAGLNDFRIQYQGGYDTITGAQTGETFFDGLTSQGYGIQVASSSYYVTLNYLSTYRYYIGIYINTPFCNISFCSNCNSHSAYAIYLNAAYQCRINYIKLISSSIGFQFQTCGWNIIDYLISNGNNQSSAYFNSSHNNIINFVQSINNGAQALYFNGSHSNLIREGISKHNSTSALGNLSSGYNYLNNFTVNESLEYISYNNQYCDNSMIFSQNHNNLGYEKIYVNYATMISQVSTLSNGSGKEWKIEVTNAARTSAYPFRYILAKVYVAANATVTVKLWMKKSHGTNIVAKLAYMGGQIAGLDSNVYSTDLTDTTETEVTLTLNQPTAAGVIEIEIQAYWGGATANVIYDKLTISQA